MRIVIWDNGGKTFDRYTVLIGRDVYGMSLHPQDPQGFGQYSHTIKKGEVYTGGTDPGKKVPFEKLPDDVQVEIARRIIDTTKEHLS